MARKPMILGAALAGLLVFAVIASGLFVARGPAAAAPGAATPAAAAPAGSQDYVTRLTQDFAARLQSDPARVDAAFTAAANETIDQAVRDGKMDADTANAARKMAAGGLSGTLRAELGGLGKQAIVKETPAPQSAAVEAIIPALGRALGLSASQLQDALKGGQSLAALEQAHHVTAAQAREAVLAAVRAAVDAGAQQGQWSRADADAAYAEVSGNYDNFLAKLTGAAGAAGGAGPGDEAFSAAGAAVARLFGFSAFGDLETALGAGQTFLALERAHNVSEAQVRDAAAAAIHAALATGVQSGRWTEAQAATAATELNAHLDDMLVKMRNAVPAPDAQDAAESAVAGLCGLTLPQLRDALRGGQSLAALEQAHQVSADQARAAALAAAHSAIAAGVTTGKWSQAQADDATRVVDRLVDRFLTGAATAGPSGK
jgi:hypothetical protein